MPLVKKKKREPRKKTPEELKREEEGSRFIRQREKLASKQGISSEEAMKLLSLFEQQTFEAQQRPQLERQAMLTGAQRLLEQRERDSRQQPVPEEATPIISPPPLPQIQPQPIQPQPTQPQAAAIPEVGLESGQAAPFTAGDVTDLATVFLGGGGIVVRTGGKALAVSGRKVAENTAKTAVKKGTGKLTAAAVASAKRLGKGILATAAGLYAGSKILAVPSSKLQAIDTELGQLRETIVAPVAAAKNGAMTPSESLDMLDDLEAAVNEHERTIKSLENQIKYTTLTPEKLGAPLARVRKLRTFINVARQDVANFAVSGQEIDVEELALLLQDFERG